MIRDQLTIAIVAFAISFAAITEVLRSVSAGRATELSRPTRVSRSSSNDATSVPNKWRPFLAGEAAVPVRHAACQEPVGAAMGEQRRPLTPDVPIPTRRLPKKIARQPLRKR